MKYGQQSDIPSLDRDLEWRRLRAVGLLALALLATAADSFGGEPLRVEIDATAERQTIQGFGCSINGWTPALRELVTRPEFADYAANELGMSVFRLQMWGGVMPEPVEDWRDIDYRNFDWSGGGSERGKVNVDWARFMVEANPDVKVIGAVWSPPAWMKENNSRTGTKAGFLLNPERDYDHDNRLRDDRYRHFAKWVVEFARYMESQGTPFYALSLQNELMFTQSFESTMYTPSEYARLVEVTGEMFESEGVCKPLFYGPEEMTLATYADEERHRPYVDALMQPGVARYFDAFATHGYSDGVVGDSRLNVVAYWEEIKRFGLPYWITEGSSGEHEWPAPLLDGIGPRLHVALTRANVSLFCGWQLAGGRGRASHHNFMQWDEPTSKTYVTMHFWRHIRPGARRVEVAPLTEEDLLASAYTHGTRGEAVVVLLNQSKAEREVTIDWGGAIAGDWEAYQTTGSRSHERVPVAVEGELGGLRLPALSITTVRATLRER